MTQATTSPSTDVDQINKLFLDILPNLKRFARRHIRNWAGLPREEGIDEAIGLALIACHSLVRRGRAGHIESAGFAHHLVRSVRNGRTTASGQQGKDAMSRLGRLRHGKAMSSLDERVGHGLTGGEGSVLGELIPDRDRPIPDQVQFKCDFGAWLGCQSPRDREMMALLAAGERPMDVARKLGCTPGVVSQRREKWRTSWSAFIEPAPVNGCASGSQVATPPTAD